MKLGIGMTAVMLGLALAGCKRPAGEPANAAANADLNVENAEANSAVTADPDTSSAAAAAVVADYAALAGKRDFTGAAELWSDPDDAAQFAADIEDYPNVAMTVGKPGAEEGAAGSIYITVPVAMKLTLRSGSPYEMTCNARLRRVNGVPGATAKQLSWNISEIDC